MYRTWSGVEIKILWVYLTADKAYMRYCGTSLIISLVAMVTLGDRFYVFES